MTTVGTVCLRGVLQAPLGSPASDGGDGHGARGVLLFLRAGRGVRADWARVGLAGAGGADGGALRGWRGQCAERGLQRCVHPAGLPPGCADGGWQPADGREERACVHVPGRAVLSALHHPLPVDLHADVVGLGASGRPPFTPTSWCPSACSSWPSSRLGHA